MKPPLKPKKSRLLLAVLVAMCLTVGACGSSTAELSPETGELSETDGPQYGDSLDEFFAAPRDSDPAPEPSTDTADLVGFERLEWDELIPPGFSGEEIAARYEDRLADTEWGTPESAAIFAEMKAEADEGGINPELDGKDVQLAGFVAPLTFVDDFVTEFLLVPYFGACIHVPAPPPNQTIMVTIDKENGMTLEDSWGAVWVAGTLTVDSTSTDLADSSYSISNAQSGVYGDGLF